MLTCTALFASVKKQRSDASGCQYCKWECVDVQHLWICSLNKVLPQVHKSHKLCIDFVLQVLSKGDQLQMLIVHAPATGNTHVWVMTYSHDCKIYSSCLWIDSASWCARFLAMDSTIMDIHPACSIFVYADGDVQLAPQAHARKLTYVLCEAMQSIASLDVR